MGLEITHYCNLTCTLCESHSRLLPAPIIKRRTYVGGRRAMDLETIDRLARSLARLGTGWVELSGKGDPIVHPKLPEIIRAIKRAGLRCSMFRTGSVPRSDLAATIVDCGLDRLNLSLNAATREAWVRVAGKDLWDQALGFLKEVLERRRAGGRRPWVRVSFVVCKDNAGEKLGTIVEQDFADIWNGPRYVDLRRRMLAMAQSQMPICPECYTSCNRALANRDVHERLGPLRILQPQPHRNGASQPAPAGA